MSVASAAPIIFSYTGKIETVDVALAGTFTTGDTVAFTYTFDSAAVGASGFFSGGLSALSTSFGSYTASSVGGPSNFGFLGVFNDVPIDAYLVGANAVVHGFSGATVAGFNIFDVTLRIEDSSLSALSNLDLPLTQPNPTDYDAFPSSFIELQFDDGVGGFLSVTASVDSLTTIPEANTVWFFCIGLAGLIVIRNGQPRESF